MITLDPLTARLEDLNPNDQSTVRGVCPDCGGGMPAKTVEEIVEARNDIGLTDEPWSVFLCDTCERKYFPEGWQHD